MGSWGPRQLALAQRHPTQGRLQAQGWHHPQESKPCSLLQRSPAKPIPSALLWESWAPSSSSCLLGAPAQWPGDPITGADKSHPLVPAARQPVMFTYCVQPLKGPEFPGTWSQGGSGGMGRRGSPRMQWSVRLTEEAMPWLGPDGHGEFWPRQKPWGTVLGGPG